MRGLDGRVGMVAGGGHGIGRATAIRLAAEGASVVVADRDHDAATATAAQCQSSGGSAVAVACDVTDRTSVAEAVDSAVRQWDQLDVLVNAVGGDLEHPEFADTADEAWHTLLELNLVGAVRVIRAALPHLLTAPTGGRVVMIGSVNGLTPFGSEPYSAAKAGLQNLTANLAVQYARRGVRFNLIAPGTVRTRVWDGQPGALERLTPLYPMGRVGEPNDIAAAAAFLASDDAAWITGVVLPVDGGILAAGPFGGMLTE